MSQLLFGHMLLFQRWAPELLPWCPTKPGWHCSCLQPGFHMGASGTSGHKSGALTDRKRWSLGRRGVGARLRKIICGCLAVRDQLCGAGKGLHTSRYSRVRAHLSCLSARLYHQASPDLFQTTRNADAWWGWGLQDNNFGVKGSNSHFGPLIKKKIKVYRHNLFDISSQKLGFNDFLY